MSLSTHHRTHIPCAEILLFYSPESVKESFFSFILTIYSLLITCAIYIFESNLSKFHALVAATTVASPLTVYMGFYALRSVWGYKHRLETVVGKHETLKRAMVLGTVTVWIAFAIYLLLPGSISQFAQASCDHYPVSSKAFFLFPVLLFAEAVLYAPQLAAAITAPILAVVLSWTLIIVIGRRTIWPNASTKGWQFKAAWSAPLILICDVLVPTNQRVPTGNGRLVTTRSCTSCPRPSCRPSTG